MANAQGAAPTRLRRVPLLLMMLALMLGILGMHGWASGHSSAGGHSAAPAVTLGTSAAATHHDGGGSHIGIKPGAGEQDSPLFSAAECAGGCGSMEMTMLSCVLAVALIGLTMLARPGSYLMRIPRRKLIADALLLPTGIARHRPSLVQLSISRT